MALPDDAYPVPCRNCVARMCKDPSAFCTKQSGVAGRCAGCANGHACLPVSASLLFGLALSDLS